MPFYMESFHRNLFIVHCLQDKLLIQKDKKLTFDYICFDIVNLSIDLNKAYQSCHVGASYPPT